MRYSFGGICVGQCGADLHYNLRKWGKSCPLIGQGVLNLNSYTVRWLKTWLSLSNWGLLYKREFKLLRKRWSDIVTIYCYIESGSESRGDESKLLHGSIFENMVIFTAFHSIPLHSTPLCSTPLHSTPLHSTPLHSTPLHSTPLHSTPLHSTPLHSTSLQLKFLNLFLMYFTVFSSCDI